MSSDWFTEWGDHARSSSAGEQLVSAQYRLEGAVRRAGRTASYRHRPGTSCWRVEEDGRTTWIEDDRVTVLGLEAGTPWRVDKTSDGPEYRPPYPELMAVAGPDDAAAWLMETQPDWHETEIVYLGRTARRLVDRGSPAVLVVDLLTGLVLDVRWRNHIGSMSLTTLDFTVERWDPTSGIFRHDGSARIWPA